MPIDGLLSNQGWFEASKTAPINSSIVTVSTTSLYFKSRQSNTKDLTTFYREKSGLGSI